MFGGGECGFDDDLALAGEPEAFEGEEGFEARFDFWVHGRSRRLRGTVIPVGGGCVNQGQGVVDGRRGLARVAG